MSMTYYTYSYAYFRELFTYDSNSYYQKYVLVLSIFYWGYTEIYDLWIDNFLVLSVQSTPG